MNQNVLISYKWTIVEMFCFQKYFTIYVHLYHSLYDTNFVWFAESLQFEALNHIPIDTFHIRGKFSDGFIDLVPNHC